ncbi:F0F1 ATP synthase subunit B [Brumimicrobium sp.]|uniref:F0F1 ATP synthase subunit B n=1 Tax=Brumimicrobium sp. TaxID=2029867 RepID=UPI00261B4921|nr:F0F1 ATP synthase subunit B [uncultured Brumimicrobium sp.]
MDLITPDLGLIFWTGLTFIILMFILTKFIWKPIMAAVNKREENIQDALDMAKKTKAEMEKLQTQNANLLKEARVERDEMIKEAKLTSDRMIDSAKSKAVVEADKIVENARVAIEAEKNAAVAQLKNEVAGVALEIAEKILRQELSTDEKQKQLAESFAKDINLN